jgi:serine/threonine/tyrosine protein kinase RAD53
MLMLCCTALVLEYVPGGDLLDYILKNNGVSEEQARDIVLQTCEALAYCHGRGITHRDLKPEVRTAPLIAQTHSQTDHILSQNILLTNDNPPMIKVADFGLAKVVDSQTMLRVATYEESRKWSD